MLRQKFGKIVHRVGDRNIFLVVALLFAALRCWNLALVQMPFNGFDEVPHIAAAYHVYKYGHMPSRSDGLDPDLFPFLEAHPHPRESRGQLHSLNVQAYKGDVQTLPETEGGKFPFHQYEAQQGPLYYHVMAALLQGEKTKDLLLWVDRGRFFNIMMFLGFVILWNVILRAAAPTGVFSWLAEGVTLLSISFSHTAYDFVRFANDGLALFLASLAFSLYCLWIKPRRFSVKGTIASWALVGGLVGLASLAKVLAMVLIPTFGLLLGWRFLQERGGRVRTALGGIALLVGYAVVAGAYHMQCLSQYGQLTGMQEAVVNCQNGIGLGTFLSILPQLKWGIFDSPFFYFGYTLVAGWSFFLSSKWIDIFFRDLVVSSLSLFIIVGLVKITRYKIKKFVFTNIDMVLFAFFVWLSLIYHTIQSTVAWGYSTTCGNYSVIVIAPTLVLLLLGPSCLGKKWTRFFCLGYWFVFNLSYLVGSYDTLLGRETGAADFFSSLAIVAGHHSALFQWTRFETFLGEIFCMLALLELCLQRIDAVESAAHTNARSQTDCGA